MENLNERICIFIKITNVKYSKVMFIIVKVKSILPGLRPHKWKIQLNSSNSSSFNSSIRLIRYFFVGPGRIPNFCVHFCSSNSSPLSIHEKRFVRLIRHLQFFSFDVKVASMCGNSNKLRIFVWELLQLAICSSNLCTRCEARPDSPLKEHGKVYKRFKRC